MPNGQNFFTFELNESLHFEKGHEVGEMLTISLDPEISIESSNDYISIRGTVELGGEYEKAVQSESEVNELEERDDTSIYRYMERIEDSGEGRAIFSHPFPVEISVPANRVTNMSDIAVNIESFDYEIPSGNQLKLTSIIKIAGIREQTNEHNEVAQEDEDTKIVEEELLDQRFEFDIKQDKEAIEDPTLETFQREHEIEGEELEQQLPPEDGQVDEEKDRWLFEKSQSFEEFFEKPKEKESKKEKKHIVEEEDTEEIEEITLETSEDIETTEEATVEKVIELEEEINYLSDMFRANEEEEKQFSQVRICIVQEKDTIETIAERYDIAESKIVKTNMLEDDELEEGQLLSIPSEVTK